MANGYQDDLTIDNNGNYEPNNCTMKEQCKSRGGKMKKLSKNGLKFNACHIIRLFFGQNLALKIG